MASSAAVISLRLVVAAGGSVRTEVAPIVAGIDAADLTDAVEEDAFEEAAETMLDMPAAVQAEEQDGDEWMDDVDDEGGDVDDEGGGVDELEIEAAASEVAALRSMPRPPPSPPRASVKQHWPVETDMTAVGASTIGATPCGGFASAAEALRRQKRLASSPASFADLPIEIFNLILLQIETLNAVAVLSLCSKEWNRIVAQMVQRRKFWEDSRAYAITTSRTDQGTRILGCLAMFCDGPKGVIRLAEGIKKAMEFEDARSLGSTFWYDYDFGVADAVRIGSFMAAYTWPIEDVLDLVLTVGDEETRAEVDAVTDTDGLTSTAAVVRAWASESRFPSQTVQKDVTAFCQGIAESSEHIRKSLSPLMVGWLREAMAPLGATLRGCRTLDTAMLLLDAIYHQ